MWDNFLKRVNDHSKLILVLAGIFLSCVLATSSLNARELVKFDMGKEVWVISDKAYRISSENRFLAIGNVIITHLDNSIYGEKADFNLATGELIVEGNVRYVGTGLTIYGSKLDYNIKNRGLNVIDARVISPNFTVIGKRLSKIKEGVYTGELAEYTTCKDCPESWSVYGKKIHITENEYVRIRSGYIKIKGVVTMYIPYIIFPIKKERESGLLFPKIGFNFADGIRFQQPGFLTLGESADLTLAPSTWGKRGLGGEVEARQFFTDQSWIKANTLFADDEVYRPNNDKIEKSGRKIFRHFSTYEQHINFGNWFNHHLNASFSQDLDMVRDFDIVTNEKLTGSEIGGDMYFDLRIDEASLGVYSNFNRNQLTPESKGVDHSYVHILPEISLALNPQALWNSLQFPIRNAYFFSDSDWTNFKQNHAKSTSVIRNASRFNTETGIFLNFASLGPVNFNSKISFEHQKYYFPKISYDNDKDTFVKDGLSYVTEANIEFEKYFGLAKKEIVAASKVATTEGETKKDLKINEINKPIIGSIDEVGTGRDSTTVRIVSNGYRHRQIMRVRHYFLSDQRAKGNEDFRQQIETSEGRFDQRDLLKLEEFEDKQSPAIALPKANTLELVWENSLIRKSPIEYNPYMNNRTIWDDFNYDKIAYFNLSQGFDFYRETEEFNEKLTRLYLDAGINLSKNVKLESEEYYFWESHSHIFNISSVFRNDYAGFNVGFRYNTKTQPLTKKATAGVFLNVYDRLRLSSKFFYDVDKKRMDRSQYLVRYMPNNDCWRFDLKYDQTLVEKSWSFEFLLRFNDKGFKSFSDAATN